MLTNLFGLPKLSAGFIEFPLFFAHETEIDEQPGDAEAWLSLRSSDKAFW